MERYFDIYLNAGNSVPVVINANQYDASETWIFTLYTDDNQQYTPASGSIVGLKSDGNTIANAGTVNSDGQVVIAETEQMTACAGINIFELILNGNHGTANFVVLVEPRPGDNATPSDSDLSLMQEAIEAASTVGTVGTLADEVTNLKSQMEVWLTEHAGMSNETILWEGELTGTGSVQLSEDASQFDTIAVYTQGASLYEAETASEAHFYKASDLIANHAVVTMAVASTVTNTATDSAIITGVVGISGTQNKTFNLLSRKGLHWSGVAEDGADIILGSSGSALITKVVGIKNEQTDAEVVAARVGTDGTQYSNLKARLDAENSSLKSAIDDICEGADGTVYQTAGEAVRTQVSDLKSQIATKSGLTADIKQALMDLANAVAFKGDDPIGQTYIDALESALYPPVNLSSISAVYTQSGTVYNTDSLNSLKDDLVVTAHYDDGTSEEVTDYILTGTLTKGTSTITVTYGGKTATFEVSVEVEAVPDEYTAYDYIHTTGSGTKNINAQMNTATYADLNALGIECDFAVVDGILSTGEPLIGGRDGSSATVSKAIFLTTSWFKIWSHGRDAGEISYSFNADQKYHLNLVESDSSPSKIYIDGTEFSIPWGTSTAVNRPFTVCNNINPSDTTYYIRAHTKLGAFKLRTVSGELVGNYIPCVRNADNVIGVYDLVSKAFYTAIQTQFATVGNSNCIYAVGNWS